MNDEVMGELYKLLTNPYLQVILLKMFAFSDAIDVKIHFISNIISCQEFSQNFNLKSRA